MTGVQVSINPHTERLVGIGIESSVGSAGDSYYNLLAETINELFKTEIIRYPQHGQWKAVDDVEYAIVKWVDWFNNRWLLESSIWIMITSGFSIYAMTDIAT